MTNERVCALDDGWLLVVDYTSGTTKLLNPAAARYRCAYSDRPPVPRIRWAPSWSTHEVPLAWEPPPRVPPRALAAAGAGLLATLTVARAGTRSRRMRRMIGLVRSAARTVRRGASAASVEETMNAIRHFGFLPNRIACLESSVATVVALALQGRGVTWHHGVRCDPLVLHAWVSVDGEPVGEPESTSRCAHLLTVNPKRMRNVHER